MCIYFIHENENNDIFSIGYAEDIEVKLSVLQMGNPRKLIVYKTIEGEHEFDIESGLREIFSPNRLEPGWFEVDTRMVDFICDMILLCADKGKNIWSALYYINKGNYMVRTQGLDCAAIYEAISVPDHNGFGYNVKVTSWEDETPLIKKRAPIRKFYKTLRSKWTEMKVTLAMRRQTV